ncbi:FAD-dependent oxidoreductase [Deinococcus peraridilitoris]|uniref:FAD dependent oxidoreductase n=1 Tax=Deinococcus peraridilitoris (strain DSM 19664 / LMG 22246 / CIP 109416 / KR-200) TaxID=937777 RepID=K9ZZL1_DEIPD|nr:FAD-dependent oxidoreductase [Deinococcus peraridilitoris]AFZ66190.1 hypothetical protein Deipe_0600 [Deinococcus peraridilitoris DSM 19664]
MKWWLTLGAGMLFALSAYLSLGHSVRVPYDLVVYGGTPQGVTAAAAGAREGLNVLLIEPGGTLGGVLTKSWLATLDLTYDAEGEPLYGGLFRPFFRKLQHDVSFDVAKAARAHREMLRDAGVHLKLNTAVRQFRQDGPLLSTLILAGGHGNHAVQARYVIDATDTAELAAQTGARFTLGRQDTGLDDRQMAATLVFRLEGVTWSALAEQLALEGQVLGNRAQVHGRSGRGLGNVTQDYVPSDPERFYLRGLNVARQDDTSLLVNGLLIFGVDGTNADSLKRAHEDARHEAERVTFFLRRALPQVFGGAVLRGVAPELYVRESRHLLGRYRLKADDVLYGRRFPDGAALGGYALDGQMYLPGEAAYGLGRPAPYQVPLRALLPQHGPTNLLVVSQAASFDSAAAFSARVAPLQMALGQAAALSVVLARQERVALPALVEHERSLARYNKLLTLRGVRLEAPGPRGNEEDAKHESFPTARALLQRGLFGAPGSTPGDLRLDDPITARAFLNSLQHLMAATPVSGQENGSHRELFSSWRARVGAHPLDKLSHAQAREILVSIGRPSAYLNSSEELLLRGESAEVLWALFQTR